MTSSPVVRALTPRQLVVVIVTVLAVVASIVGLVTVVPPAVRAAAPERPVRAYLEAIVGEHIDQALKLGHIAATAGDKLLTRAAYDSAADRVTAFSVIGTTVNGSSGTVGVRIHQRNVSYVTSFRITRAPGLALFAPWKLEPQTLPKVEFALAAAIDDPISIAGIRFDTKQGATTQRVFPGTYEGKYAGTSDYFFGVAATASTTFTTATVDPAEIGLELEPAGGTAAEGQVASWVSRCATSSELHPAGCPFRAIADPGVTYSNGHWALQSQPKLEESAWNAELGGWPVTTSSPGYISYSADATEGALTGTATTGSKPFTVAGTIVPDAGGGIRFVPSPVYSSDSAAVPNI